jgi:flagellar assembly protein FliH
MGEDVSTEGRKYFFDLNNFDGTSAPEPEEDLPPPPPVFSEDELETEKKQSLEEGRIIGRQEEQQSRAQYIATQISELNTQILSLILSEQIREKKFEQEVIHLCRALVGKLFPALLPTAGYTEIETVIERVISKQPLSQIHIEVPKDDAEDIKTYLLSLKDIEPNRLHIHGVDNLSKGSCRMKWQDGGAVRDHQALSQAIFAELDEVLAPIPQKVQNSESVQKSPDETVEANNGEEHG